jgi:hypothetical protein
VRSTGERAAVGRLEQHGLRIGIERRGNHTELGGTRPALEFTASLN